MLKCWKQKRCDDTVKKMIIKKRMMLGERPRGS